MITKQEKLGKRLFDILLSMILIPIILIPLTVFFLLASMSTQSLGWFSQKRVGKEGRLFCLYKIKTLKGKNHLDSVAIQEAETPFGHWLRKTKLDELPQIFNVLLGDMSFVGPRPDVPGYADRLQGEDRILLSVRPGITGPATLKYKNEDQLLLAQKNPLQYNDTVIWPDKVAINKAYLENWSFMGDINYLWKSFF